MSAIQEQLFSEDVINAVRQTWHKLDSNGSTIGQAIFMKLFVIHPDYQTLFPKMKDIPYTELPNNKAFIQHATSVEKKLNFAVDTLDDPDKLVNDFSELGKRHVQYNLTEDNFKNVQTVIENTLKDALQSEYDESVQKAWNLVLTAAVGAIIEGAIN